MAKKTINEQNENPYANGMTGAIQTPDVSTAEQRAFQLRQQIANRGDFAYDPNSDPLWGAAKDQYMHAGKRAMEDTIGQAAGLTGGYANTYAQSAGQQSYNEYLTKLNAELPAYFDRARAAWDADTQNLYNLYGLERDQAQLDYNRSRDELADQRYQDELAYSRERDALADQRYADELQYSRDQSAQERAYNMAMQMMSTGQMPSASLLSAAGIDSDYAKSMSGYYSRMLALQNAGSSGGSSDGTRGTRYSRTPNKEEPPKAAQTTANVIKPAEQDKLLAYALSHSKDDFDAYFKKNYGKMKNYDEVYEWIRNRILNYSGSANGNIGEGGGGGNAKPSLMSTR